MEFLSYHSESWNPSYRIQMTIPVLSPAKFITCMSNLIRVPADPAASANVQRHVDQQEDARELRL
jgi:hypothetical protein